MRIELDFRAKTKRKRNIIIPPVGISTLLNRTDSSIMITEFRSIFLLRKKESQWIGLMSSIADPCCVLFKRDVAREALKSGHPNGNTNNQVHKRS